MLGIGVLIKTIKTIREFAPMRGKENGFGAI